MPVGYTEPSVVYGDTGVSWSFTATAVAAYWDQVKVVCGDFSAQASPAGTTASVLVTGSVAYSDPEYRDGEKTYTVTQYVKASGPQYEWAIDEYDIPYSTTVTVEWKTGGLRIVENGVVTMCSNIKVKDGEDIKTVVAAYSVEDGVVKPWI